TSGEGVPDSGLAYDAIALERTPNVPSPISAYAEPTIFYERQGEALLERIEIFVRYAERPRSSQIDFELGGKHYRRSLVGGQDFGEERLLISVPEFGAGALARIRIELNGRNVESSETLHSEKKWTLFVVPHVHLDVGYTDYQ